jgi:hypothetical protein
MARRVDQVRELQTLIQAQATVRDQQSRIAQAGVRQAFSAIDNWADPVQTRRAVNQSVKVVTAAQRRVAGTTDAYMARSTSTITGRRSDTVGAVDVRSLRRKLPQDVIEALADGRSVTQAMAERAQSRVEAVAPEEVYGRVADHVRFITVSRGISPEQAALEGLRRAGAAADTDIMLADRAQVQRFLTQRRPSGVVGYRRVLHPELGSGAPPCGLCVVAATRVYHIEDLMPIHSRCRCSVAVLTKENDPGLQLNDDDLKTVLSTVYQAAGGNTRNQLKTVRVEFAEHGELGPIIVNATQNFRGPDDFARTQSQDLEKRWLAEVEALQEQLTGLVGRAGESSEVDAAIKWNKQKIRELSKRLP